MARMAGSATNRARGRLPAQSNFLVTMDGTGRDGGGACGRCRLDRDFGIAQVAVALLRWSARTDSPKVRSLTTRTVGAGMLPVHVRSGLRFPAAFALFRGASDV